MKKLFELLLLSAAIVFSTDICAQVKIGGSVSATPPSEPQKGITLDLSTSDAAYVGGMLLPNVVIDKLSHIPVSMTDFATKPETERDMVIALAGSMVYHPGGGENNYPKGVYLWDGNNWVKSECCPTCTNITEGYIHPFPETIAESDSPITFYASHNGSEKGTVYTWFVLNCEEFRDFENGTLPNQPVQSGAVNSFSFDIADYLNKINNCSGVEKLFDLWVMVVMENECSSSTAITGVNNILTVSLDCPFTVGIASPIFINAGGNLMGPGGWDGYYSDTDGIFNFVNSTIWKDYTFTTANNTLGSANGLSVKVQMGTVIPDSPLTFYLEQTGPIPAGDDIITIPVAIFGRDFTFRFRPIRQNTFALASPENSIYVMLEDNGDLKSNTIQTISYSGGMLGANLTETSYQDPTTGFMFYINLNGIDLDAPEKGKFSLNVGRVGPSTLAPGIYPVNNIPLLGQTINLNVVVQDKNVDASLTGVVESINIYFDPINNEIYDNEWIKSSNATTLFNNYQWPMFASYFGKAFVTLPTITTNSGLTLSVDADRYNSSTNAGDLMLNLASLPTATGDYLINFTLLGSTKTLTLHVIQSSVSDITIEENLGNPGTHYIVVNPAKTGGIQPPVSGPLSVEVHLDYTGFNGSGGSYNVLSDVVNGMQLIGSGNITDTDGKITLQLVGNPLDTQTHSIPFELFGRKMVYKFTIACEPPQF